MKKRRILIVDDETEICLHIKEAFEYEDWNADFVTTGRAAFEKLETENYDLIMTDIQLGGLLTGSDIIKSFSGKKERPKIVVISAIPLDDLSPLFERDGILPLIDGFLDKPSCCNPERLIGLANKVMNGVS